jgi:hypothetical protein
MAPRDLDDDAPRRIRAAEELIRVATQQSVLAAELDLARRRRSDRIWWYGIAGSVLALLAAVSGTALTWKTSRFIVGDVICGAVLLLAATAMTVDYFVHRQYLESRPHLEAQLAERQEAFRSVARLATFLSSPTGASCTGKRSPGSSSSTRPTAASTDASTTASRA